MNDLWLFLSILDNFVQVFVVFEVCGCKNLFNFIPAYFKISAHIVEVVKLSVSEQAVDGRYQHRYIV